VATKFAICVILSRSPGPRHLERTPEAEQTSPSYPVSPRHPPELCEATVRFSGDNTGVDLARISWLLTVAVCLIVVLILVLQGYLGYAAVTFAVAISAGINLS
jgi:hypothetical protein